MEKRIKGVLSCYMSQCFIRAISIARKVECDKVYPIHMAVALTYPDASGKARLNIGNAKYEDVIEAFSFMVENGAFRDSVKHGKIDDEALKEGYMYAMSEELIKVFNKCGIDEHNHISEQDIIKNIVEACNNEIKEINNFYEVNERFRREADPREILGRIFGQVAPPPGTVMGMMISNDPNIGTFANMLKPNEGSYEDIEFFDEEEIAEEEQRRAEEREKCTKEFKILKSFGVDLCEKAETKGIEPLIGREKEIDSIVEILCHKNKPNPMILGEPGVGKTVLVDGLAERIVGGKVPASLQGRHIISIDMGRVKAGTSYRGSLEQRVMGIIDAAIKTKSILFFDEFHQFTSGRAEGGVENNVSNIFKPYIANGELAIVGATTLEEYKRGVEKDFALVRRFATVHLQEISADNMIEVARRAKVSYEEFHNVSISNEVSDEIVKLADRYIKDKHFPDKAFSIMDEAAAKTKMKNKSGKQVPVNIDTVYQAISKITGVDIGELTQSEMSKLQKLEESISQRLIGQEQAVSVVSRAIRRNKVGLSVKTRPIGSFLFVGPTGVGKTELCNVLATKFGRNSEPVRFDMSEYSEEYSISKLIGAAPGYVGYSSGGTLTEAIKHNPYSVILFDEIEKAHSNIYNILLQMLDNASITDSNGIKVDCSNCIIVLTSNAGYGADTDKPKIGFGTDAEAVSTETVRLRREKQAIKELEKTFKPEILNRLDNIVIFEKLSDEACDKIVRLMLKDLANKMAEQGIILKYSKRVYEFITKEGFNEKYGARNLRRTIQSLVENPLADKIISGYIKSGDIVNIGFGAGSIKIEKR